MSRKATWQRHADPRSAYVARYIHISIYLFIVYKRGFQPFLNGRGIRTTISVGRYKPDGFHLPFPCETKVPHTVLTAGHVEREEPLDRAERTISRVDRVDERPTDPSYKHVLFKGSYNGWIIGDVAAS